MTQGEYDTIVRYTQEFDEMRQVYNDQQLLEWCHTVMQKFVDYAKDGPFDPMPPEEPPPEGQEALPPETLGQQLASLQT